MAAKKVKSKVKKSGTKGKRKPAAKKVAAKKTAAPKAKRVKKETPVEDLPKRKRRTVSMCISKDELSKEALKLIESADKLEVNIADAEDELGTTLKKIVEATGGASFEHPQRGAMTIMSRGGKFFWRGKPSGKELAAE